MRSGRTPSRRAAATILVAEAFRAPHTYTSRVPRCQGPIWRAGASRAAPGACFRPGRAGGRRVPPRVGRSHGGRSGPRVGGTQHDDDVDFDGQVLEDGAAWATPTPAATSSTLLPLRAWAVTTRRDPRWPPVCRLGRGQRLGEVAERFHRHAEERRPWQRGDRVGMGLPPELTRVGSATARTARPRWEAVPGVVRSRSPRSPRAPPRGPRLPAAGGRGFAKGEPDAVDEHDASGQRPDHDPEQPSQRVPYE